MCMICVDLIKDKLTSKEAWRNFEEMEQDIDAKHIAEIYVRIIDKQIEENEEGGTGRAGLGTWSFPFDEKYQSRITRWSRIQKIS